MIQLRLSIPANYKLLNSPTFRDQMRGQNKVSQKTGTPIRHYYKDWKKSNYEK